MGFLKTIEERKLARLWKLTTTSELSSYEGKVFEYLKRSYGSTNPVDRAVASLLNAVLTEKVGVFILSRATCNELMTSDPNFEKGRKPSLTNNGVWTVVREKFLGLGFEIAREREGKRPMVLKATDKDLLSALNLSSEQVEADVSPAIQYVENIDFKSGKKMRSLPMNNDVSNTRNNTNSKTQISDERVEIRNEKEDLRNKRKELIANPPEVKGVPQEGDENVHMEDSAFGGHIDSDSESYQNKVGRGILRQAIEDVEVEDTSEGETDDEDSEVQPLSEQKHSMARTVFGTRLKADAAADFKSAVSNSIRSIKHYAYMRNKGAIAEGEFVPTAAYGVIGGKWKALAYDSLVRVGQTRGWTVPELSIAEREAISEIQTQWTAEELNLIQSVVEERYAA